MRKSINFGDVLICAETGKQFIAAQEGISTNYATNLEGEVFSNEGAYMRGTRELLDRSKPYYCYISSDGKHVTDWKGNILGDVVYWNYCKLTRQSYTHGKQYRTITVRDVHGNMWYGRGSPGICVTLRAKKGK